MRKEIDLEGEIKMEVKEKKQRWKWREVLWRAKE